MNYEIGKSLSVTIDNKQEAEKTNQDYALAGLLSISVDVEKRLIVEQLPESHASNGITVKKILEQSLYLRLTGDQVYHTLLFFEDIRLGFVQSKNSKPRSERRTESNQGSEKIYGWVRSKKGDLLLPKAITIASDFQRENNIDILDIGTNSLQNYAVATEILSELAKGIPCTIKELEEIIKTTLKDLTSIPKARTSLTYLQNKGLCSVENEIPHVTEFGSKLITSVILPLQNTIASQKNLYPL